MGRATTLNPIIPNLVAIALSALLSYKNKKDIISIDEESTNEQRAKKKLGQTINLIG